MLAYRWELNSYPQHYGTTALWKFFPDIQFMKIVNGSIMNTPTISCIMKLQDSSTANTLKCYKILYNTYSQPHIALFKKSNTTHNINTVNNPPDPLIITNYRNDP